MCFLRSIRRNQRAPIRTSKADQQRRYAGDTGMNFTATIAQTSVEWGARTRIGGGIKEFDRWPGPPPKEN